MSIDQARHRATVAVARAILDADEPTGKAAAIQVEPLLRAAFALNATSEDIESEIKRQRAERAER